MVRMKETLEAVYENGVFKPLARLQLPEHQAVHLILEETGECSESMEILAVQGGSFDFLGKTEENIYSLSDGRPLD